MRRTMSMISSTVTSVSRKIATNPTGPGVTTSGSKDGDGDGVGVVASNGDVVTACLLVRRGRVRRTRIVAMTLRDGLRADGADERLQARYGTGPSARRRNRLIGLVLAALALVALLAWGVWTGFGGAAGEQLDVTTPAFTVQGDSAVTVTWSVAGSSRPLACTVEADAEDHTTVGVVVVTVPPGGGTGTTTVRTVRRAVTGLISTCRAA